ncbi:MAG: hypothetical protein K0R38_6920 [Polyangiaceae bacterium]|jgi:hypothetical protein|nr:hypothetical protein [Polyangiaceae bacterium]
MRWFLAAILLLHGLIHFLGPLKASGLASLPNLHKAISFSMSLIWLLAGVLTLAAVAAMWLWPSGLWALGLGAVIASQIAIFNAWSDAKLGTLGDLLLLCVSATGFFMYGPGSLYAQFRQDRSARVTKAARLVTDADLEPLPKPVQRYLRAVGVVGHPHVQRYSLHFRGRIRGAPNDPWMPFKATQVSFANPSSRLFWMQAEKAGLPVAIYHRFVGGSASMRVMLLGALEMVDAAGATMDRAETVTLFNDMCLLAPATLLEPNIAWKPVDDRTTEARFSHGRNTITATLRFDDDGLLRDFISDDRWRLGADGKSAERRRFSTPIRDYRNYGSFLLASHGDARWHLPEGDFTYGEFDLIDVTYNDVR